MARALESVPVANASHVAAWVQALAAPVLRKREQRLADIESDWAHRTGAPQRPRSAPPSDAQRDASTRAVTYAAGPESGTRVEGLRRRQEPASLFDTVDRAPPSRGSPARPIGVWIALAAGAAIAAAGLLDRRDEVQGWLRHTPAGASSGPASATAPQAPAPTAVGRPAPPAAAMATAPITVSVESLPIAAPPSIPIEALPEAAPSSRPAAPPGRHSRPRRH
jgi:hypothetical protein